jgi:hypothetical protein
MQPPWVSYMAPSLLEMIHLDSTRSERAILALGKMDVTKRE